MLLTGFLERFWMDSSEFPSLVAYLGLVGLKRESTFGPYRHAKVESVSQSREQALGLKRP